MAPFMNESLPTEPIKQQNKQYDYSQFGSNGYEVPQDRCYRDPSNRKIRVLTIGAGISGILMAYQIQKQCENVEHVIYEKNENIGGTWLENRYPRAGCDIPSHAYTYQFALNPEWPRYFSFAPEIWSYLDKVCEAFDLRKYMNFHTEVVGCFWQEETGEWLVKLRDHRPGMEPREFEDRCHVLMYGAGVLNNFKWPEIPGLQNTFKGRIVHTARWPKDWAEEDWKNERVAILGSGASSIQTVPGMQPHTKHLDVFVRTGVYFGVLAGNSGSQAKTYSSEEKNAFRLDPDSLVAHAKEIEDQVNGMWGGFYSGSMGQKMGSMFFKKRMAEHIKDERLLKGFIPTYGLGCRRITPGDVYMDAVQQNNVDVHFTPVVRCTEDGVIGGDGIERKVDSIVCATGFDVSYRPRFPVIGKNGVDLRDQWKVCPEAYLGLAIPNMPNFVTFIGPSWPIENGSVMAPLHSVSEYALQLISKMQNENVRSFTPRQDVTDKFNEHVQEWVKHTVWKDDCRSWYKNNETGRVNAIWPGSSLHYQQVIEKPRYEDFQIDYFDSNPWAHLGMGWTVEDRLGPKKADVSPYLCKENIDPRWFAAIGGDVNALRTEKVATSPVKDDCQTCERKAVAF
ncbi:hypothetical protein CBER1_03410 [Cercospora berteroae]|uniref:Sterigmatocystin biosynthesis monooxygenase stcW n=1 Tax=Cercospora berteroae TaxID=357750 RepID=A0A2S6C8F8_9PEZI|nr:hypothetical protein CBER1_03410 [Cercospora berteroae]